MWSQLTEFYALYALDCLDMFDGVRENLAWSVSPVVGKGVADNAKEPPEFSTQLYPFEPKGSPRH